MLVQASGLVIALVAGLDAVHTLVLARPTVSRWWPTEVFTRLSWRVWSGMGRRFTNQRKAETFLAVYTPLSLLALLVLWVSAIVLGFGLVWWGAGDGVAPAGDLGQSIYFSGIAFLTIGFGDILPVEGATRALVLVEGFAGLAVVALVIGFLPATYQAYGARETALLTLDHPSREQLRAIDLVGTMWQHGGVPELRSFCREWDRWVAELITTHRPYPFLMYFRSQNPGQSWLTGLGLIADTATMARVMLDEPPPEVIHLHRRATRALVTLATRLGVRPKPGDPITKEMFVGGVEVARSYGLPIGSVDEGFARMHELRAGYVGHLEALIDHLVSPRGFWGHEAADDPRLRIE
jgi:hypothetical protein